ncbi:unnamed protein product [Ixodes hexagonus]
MLAAASVNQKTPISILQELCARNCLTPEYKLLSVEGAVHAPTFMYRVQVGDVVANATGQSKKKSKHAAAKVLLEKLLADDGLFCKYRAAVLEDLPMMETPEVIPTAVGDLNVSSNGGLPAAATPAAAPTAAATAGVAAVEEDGIPGNPVGALQELCMKLRWRPPFYETVIEEGLPHERTFGISCLVNNLSEMGKGKSKRLAKRQAAYKMIQLIEHVQNGEINGEDEKFGEPGGLCGSGGGLGGIVGNSGVSVGSVLQEAKCYMGLKEQNINTLTPRHSQQVGQLLRQLQGSDGVRLGSLQGTPLNTAGLDYVGLLREIADEQSFEVTYVPIEELSTDGKHQCLVQLTSLPLAVCFGTAESPEQARAAAARSALQYLKIMTKK